MNRRTSYIVLVGVIFIATLTLFWMQREHSKNITIPLSDKIGGSAATIRQEKQNIAVKVDSIGAAPKAKENLSIILNENNFEEMVLECFQGKACELGEDPWKLYQEFKRSQHTHATDLLLSFLRRQLHDPVFKEKYADTLLSMIKDFYSPQELPFQMAAYYSYLGDLQKSLELYLDLEKRSQTDSSLRPAPKLNIANVYYDMHNCAAALPYYQAALDHYSAKHNIDTQTRDLMQFIEKRIEECRKL